MTVITPPNELSVQAVDESEEGKQRMIYTITLNGEPITISETTPYVVINTEAGLQRALVVYNLNSQSPVTDIDVSSFKEGVIQTTLSDSSTDEQIPTAAAAVSYVSGELANYTTTEDLNTLLADKLDKVATAGDTRAYGIGSDGSQTVYTISGTATGSTIAIRNADGELAVATPTADGSAATKKYVDDGLSGKQETLVSGTNIKTLNSTSLLGSGDLSIDGLPSQTGQSGKFLTTDGSSASWDIVPSVLPSQTGQSGKFLTTDGTDPSWATVSAGGAAYLFQHQWSDHILTEENWLRADTFDWHSGVTYPDAYNELVSEYNDPDATTHNEEDYTVVGSPTIVDGIASGFDTNNYLKSPKVLDVTSPWKYRTKIVVKSPSTAQYFFQLCSSVYSIEALITNTSLFRIGFSSNGTSWNIGVNSGTHVVAEDDVYYIEIGWTGTVYYLDYSTDNENWTREISFSSTAIVKNDNTAAFIPYNTSAWQGSIDLNYTYFENSAGFSWNARISYKITPKGYYITTSEYLPQISGIYNSEGKELFYVLDTANTQFKLPRLGLTYSYFYGAGEPDPLASPATLADTLPMANTDLSNISDAGRGIMASGITPDYTARISITRASDYTCPADGQIVGLVPCFTIRGVTFGVTNNADLRGPLTLCVNKGDIFRWDAGTTSDTVAYFCPYKGAI